MLKNKLFFFILTSIIIISCGNPASNNNSSQNDLSSSAIITSDGGTVAVGNKLSIAVPQNALSEAVKIKATLFESTEKIPKEELPPRMLAMAEFGPSGTTFSSPAAVTMKTGATAGKDLSVYLFDETEKCWTYFCQATTNADSSIVFEVSHFSKYVALDITMPMMEKFNSLVKQYAPNDTKIIESFRDFLVDDCGVMDYISKFGEFYYKPRNLLVSGDYYVNGTENTNTLSSVYGQEYKPTNTIHSIASLTTRTQSEYKKKVNNLKEHPEEEQFVTRCLADIQYEMIVPEILLTASDTELNPGESCEFSIWCTDPDGTLDLDKYPLSIKSTDEKILSVSKKNVTTDSEGKAKLSVTRHKRGSASVKVFFVASDLDNEPVTTSQEFTFEDSDDDWNFTVNIKHNAFGNYVESYLPYSFNTIKADCPDQTFEYGYTIKGGLSILPLPDVIKNSIYANGFDGIVCGHAVFSCDKSKTKYTLNPSYEEYNQTVNSSEIFHGTYENSFDVSLCYNDIEADIVGVLYSDGTVQFSVCKLNDKSICNNIKSEDDFFELFMGQSLNDELIKEYQDSTKGVFSAKITNTYTVLETPESGNTNGTKKYDYFINAIPDAVIRTKLKAVLNHEIVTDDMAETDCISIPSDNLSLFDYKYYGESDLSTDYYKCNISFEKK